LGLLLISVLAVFSAAEESSIDNDVENRESQEAFITESIDLKETTDYVNIIQNC
jgi:hypothetical protein